MTQRIQRKRTKGWRKPPGAIYIGRGTSFGNPFRISGSITRAGSIYLFRNHLMRMEQDFPAVLEIMTNRLRGKQIMCWCAEHQACHGDVWLEFIYKEGGK